MAILFGLGVFAILVAVGWRSVQSRRILRLQGADGQETIIVAREDDDISSVVTTTEAREPVAVPPSAPEPSVVVADAGVGSPAAAPKFGRSAPKRKAAVDLNNSA